MINEEIILISLIVVNTIASIIGTLKGNKDITLKAEEKRQKALKKLQQKHKKTEDKYLQEDKKIKELDNYGNKQ